MSTKYKTKVITLNETLGMSVRTVYLASTHKNIILDFFTYKLTIKYQKIMLKMLFFTIV